MQNSPFAPMASPKREPEQKWNQIQWYAADMNDSSIIAYGFITDNPKPTDRKVGRDFKITWKKFKYGVWRKIGRKFCFLGNASSLENAQILCLVELQDNPR